MENIVRIMRLMEISSKNSITLIYQLTIQNYLKLTLRKDFLKLLMKKYYHTIILPIN